MLKIFFLLFLLCADSVLADELKIVTAESFVAENPSPERKELVNFLVGQFNGRSVTQKQLDILWNNKKARSDFMMARFQIVNQKLYADSFDVDILDTGHYDTGYHYFICVLNYLRKFVTKYKVKDVDFIIYMRETIPITNELGKETLGVPSFLMFQDIKSSFEKDKFLFPDPFFLVKTWQTLLNSINEARNLNKWQDKIDKVFWRGGTTGDFVDYKISNFDKLQRLDAVMLSHLYPDLIDAEFSSFPTFQFLMNKDGRALKKIIDLLSKKKNNNVSETDHLKYKYLLSIDGNSATGTRIPWIMFSDSILFKQTSNKIEWFYTALKPYVNYVPVNHRLTDVFEQIKWMKNHDEELKIIAKNAHSFVLNNLLPEHIDSHIAIILNEYHSISKDKEIIVSLPEADDDLFLKNIFTRWIERQKTSLIGWLAICF